MTWSGTSGSGTMRTLPARKRPRMVEIKSWLGEVLHRSEKETIKQALEEAVLRGADLSGADLSGAKIVEGGTMLTGYALGYFWWAAPTDKGILLQHGCERGTVAEWRANARAWAIQHERLRPDKYERF